MDTNGALGHLITLSKSGPGLGKMYAMATLNNLEHDTAALRIQAVFRGMLGRGLFTRRTKLHGDRLKAAAEAHIASSRVAEALEQTAQSAGFQIKNQRVRITKAAASYQDKLNAEVGASHSNCGRLCADHATAASLF